MNKQLKTWSSLLGIGATLLLSNVAHAITKTWNNPAGGSWATAANWTPAGAPQNGDDVVIALSGTYSVTYVPGTQTNLNSFTLGGATGVQTLNKPAFTLNVANASFVTRNGVLTQTAGTIGGAGSLTDDGVFNFSGGTVTGTGALAIGVSGTANFNGNNKTLQRNVTNAGTLNYSGAGLLSLGAGNTLTNNGTFAIASGSSINKTGAGANPVITNNNILTKSGGGTASLSSVNFVNTGATNLVSGSIATNSAYTQSGGSTNFNGGDLATTTVINVSGGTVTGTGTISGSVNNSGGTITPGAPLGGVGVITVGNDYTQSGSGAYGVDINGPAVSQYDVLTVGGAATLAGPLNVTVNYPEMSGDSFQVLNFGSRSGVFAPVTVTNANLDTVYNPNNLTLVVVTLTTNITTPVDGGFVIAPSTVRGTATRTPNSVAIAGVNIQVQRDSDGLYYTGGTGGTFQAAQTSFPANFDPATGTFATNNGPNSSKVLAGQTFTITAIAVDTNGNMGAGPSVNVTADNLRPTITSDNAPPQNTPLMQSQLPATLTGTASDPNETNSGNNTSSGLRDVRYTLRRSSDGFYYNGSTFQSGYATVTDSSATTPANSGATVNYSLPFPTNLADGNYVLVITAYDKVNINSGVGSITAPFTVQNSMPVAAAASGAAA